MTEVVLFHSAYGLRPAVRAIADRFRRHGHRVTVPDLYGGATADTLAGALALRDAIGREALLARAREVVADTPPGAVLAGLSLGAALAQHLAAGDPTLRGLLLMHGTTDPPPLVGVGLPVQLHVGADDPFEEPAWVRQWASGMRRAGAVVEVFTHPGGHLYTDPDLPEHEIESTEATLLGALVFLDEVAMSHR